MGKPNQRPRRQELNQLKIQRRKAARRLRLHQAAEGLVQSRTATLSNAQCEWADVKEETEARRQTVDRQITVFRSYEKGDPLANKQDCELRAFPRLKWGNRPQRFHWVNGIEYCYGENHRKRQILHVVICEESWKELDPDSTQIVEKTSRHGWMPNGYNGCCVPQAGFAWSNANTPTEIHRDCTLCRHSCLQ